MPVDSRDCDGRDPAQVLRLRFRDWVWPSALAVVIILPLIGSSFAPGPYRIGSFQFYVNAYGPTVWLLAMFVAGARWCWIGRMRPRRENCCGRCGYPTRGLDPSDAHGRCPECGTGFPASHPGTRRSGFRRRFEGLTFLRALLDLPGLLLMSFPAYVVTLLFLVILGVIEID